MACVYVTRLCVYGGGVGWWTQAITFIREKKTSFYMPCIIQLTSFPSFLSTFFLTTIYRHTHNQTKPTVPFFFALFRPFFLLEISFFCKFVQMWMMRDESSWVFIHTDRQTNAVLKCNIIMHMHYNNVKMDDIVCNVCIFLIQKISSPRKNLFLQKRIEIFFKKLQNNMALGHKSEHGGTQRNLLKSSKLLLLHMILFNFLTSPYSLLILNMLFSHSHFFTLPVFPLFS